MHINFDSYLKLFKQSFNIENRITLDKVYSFLFGPVRTWNLVIVTKIVVLYNSAALEWTSKDVYIIYWNLQHIDRLW